MPFPLVGTPGNLFNVLGKIGAVLANVRNAQAAQQSTLVTGNNSLVDQLVAQPDIAATIGSNWQTWLSASEAPCGTMQTTAQAYMNRLVYNAQPQLNQTFSSNNLNASINYILQQMAAQKATILQMTVGATPSTFASTGSIGNGVVTASAVRPFDGRTLENAFAEILTFTCVADSYTGNAAAFNEQFAVTGEGAQTDVFAYNWPLGSNASISINAIDGDTSNGAGNLLTNSGFAAWTTGVPNNWSVLKGASTITQNSSIVFSKGSSLQLTGDGTTLTSIAQAFNSATGTQATLSPQTAYSCNLFLRTSGTAPAQGVLQVDLIDGSGNIINDQAGVPNSFTVTLSTLNTAWTAFNGYFRLPAALPSSYSIRLSLTTALNNGAVVYVDKLSLGLAAQTYVQGPFVALHSGSIPFVASPTADYTTCNITNSRGAGGTLATFQTLLYQLLAGAINYELLWPSSANPTIPDSLIA